MKQLLNYGRSPPKDPFPVRELVTSQRSWSFVSESIRDRTHGCLSSKASQPLTSLFPADREVASVVPMLISGF
ncbi:hypothetical protein TNCV_867421 [Trichonephila clavipes]|nr:hypothetical protein TNCV_867421 [Trichonephila clavipes]